MIEHGQDVFKDFEKVFEGSKTPADVTEDLKTLGNRYVQGGVFGPNFGTISEALIKTIQQILEDKFDQESKDLWIRICRAVESGF